MTNVRALLKPFLRSSSFHVIKFSSFKCKNNNTLGMMIKPRFFVPFSSYLSPFFNHTEKSSTKEDETRFLSLSTAFFSLVCRIEGELKWISVLRDTYHDMLHDNGFRKIKTSCRKLNVFVCRATLSSISSTWTSNPIHINNDTVASAAKWIMLFLYFRWDRCQIITWKMCKK